MKYGYMRDLSPQAKSANLLSQVKTKTYGKVIFIEKKIISVCLNVRSKLRYPRTDLPHILIGGNSEEPRDCS